jgi:hypothetical protein
LNGESVDDGDVPVELKAGSSPTERRKSKPVSRPSFV